MKAPRRAYRPEIVADLESRLALSHVAAAAAVQHVHKPTERAEVSTMLQPSFTVTWNGPYGTQVHVMKESGRVGAGGELLSSVATQLPDPETMAIGVPPNAALVTITCQNDSKTNITSATITDKLNPGMTMVPGSASSATNGVVATTTEVGGVQTVQLSLVGGIPADSDGSVQFEVERSG